MDQGGVVAGKIQQTVPIDVEEMAPLTAIHHCGIGTIKESAPRISTGEIVPGFGEEPAGRGSLEPVALLLRGNCSLYLSRHGRSDCEARRLRHTASNSPVISPCGAGIWTSEGDQRSLPSIRTGPRSDTPIS